MLVVTLMELVRVLLIAIVFVLVCYSTSAATGGGWVVSDQLCTSAVGSGVCINRENCTVLYKYVLRGNLSSDLICDRKESKVCCPFILPGVVTRTNATVNHKLHANYKLLPRDCGLTEEYKVLLVRGEETLLFEFPWAVALKYNSSSNPWKCGASLINERYVLTAAHCIKAEWNLTTVRLGEHDLEKDVDCIIFPRVCADPPKDFEVSENDTIIHPDYDDKTYENDIALIRLRKPVKFRDSISPICLPLTVAEKTADFQKYTVIGWGGTTNDSRISSLLLKVQVPTVANLQCASKYASKRNISKNHLCAGGNRRDTCRGDSGNPLMARYELDGRLRTIQYGIVTLGPSICAYEGYPTLYTRVANYMQWILDSIQP